MDDNRFYQFYEKCRIDAEKIRIKNNMSFVSLRSNRKKTTVEQYTKAAALLKINSFLDLENFAKEVIQRAMNFKDHTAVIFALLDFLLEIRSEMGILRPTAQDYEDAK